MKAHAHADKLPDAVHWAVEAAQAKQAGVVVVLDLSALSAFTDFFLICSAGSSPQMGAIRDAVEETLHRHNIRPAHYEGRRSDDWTLIDYGGFVVHIFTEQARQFYDLERLWRTARRVEFPEHQPAQHAEGHS
ncbi:MAG: ribosome silencing factor [Acidobacteria bacterium]|nr:ribosome silencing factor [Acidobacteriota bacterium]